MACSGSSSSQTSSSGSGSPSVGQADEQDQSAERPGSGESEQHPGEEGAARPAGNFERFLLTGHETPCPREARGDCQSFAELRSDGTLRMDPWGEPGSPVLEAQVPGAALAQAIPALTDPQLLALLGRAAACPTANHTETILVRLAGADHQNATGYCNEGPIQAVRAAIQGLTTQHFPEHSLISPPF